MKILALVSSHRKKGNTTRIVQMIEGHMQAIAARQQQALEFDTLYLGDMNVQFCRGCRTCFDRGGSQVPLEGRCANHQGEDGRRRWRHRGQPDLYG